MKQLNQLTESDAEEMANTLFLPNKENPKYLLAVFNGCNNAIGEFCPPDRKRTGMFLNKTQIYLFLKEKGYDVSLVEKRCKACGYFLREEDGDEFELNICSACFTNKA